ncbi:hypothetical protein PAMP_002005 [Pampus punctatissimus]
MMQSCFACGSQSLTVNTALTHNLVTLGTVFFSPSSAAPTEALAPSFVIRIMKFLHDIISLHGIVNQTQKRRDISEMISDSLSEVPEASSLNLLLRRILPHQGSEARLKPPQLCCLLRVLLYMLSCDQYKGGIAPPPLLGAGQNGHQSSTRLKY